MHLPEQIIASLGLSTIAGTASNAERPSGERQTAIAALVETQTAG